MKKINLIIFFLFTLIVNLTFLSLEKSNGQTNSSSSSSSGECIICTQVIPNCSSNGIIVPQSCHECAHCISTSSNSSGCLQIQTNCSGEPSGCGAKFGIYDPKICMCVCSDSTSSSSGSLNCTSDNDCPPSICSSSGTFKNYSCGNGICNQIFYFADPCQFQSSSSSGDLIIKHFSGIWKGKVSDCNGGSISLNNDQESECIVCPQIAILCAQGFTSIPQSCHKCAHCEKCKSFKTTTLKLCIKDQKLKGTVNISNEIKNENITSQEIISNKEIDISTSSGKSLKLRLIDTRHLNILFSGQTFELRKTRLSKNCSSTNSGKDCSPKGSCRGENGEELSCPVGTECSGLPAYGCYPPGCPVPICCSPDTKIKTDGVQKRIADIREGEVVLTDGGKAVRVKKVSKTPVKNHKVLKITLSDGTILEISPGHPTTDGRKLKELKMGDILDGRMVVETKLIPYIYSHTYDILPDSKAGNYYANGVLIGSSLK